MTTDNTCKTQLQTWQSNCGGSPLEGDFFDLPKEEGDGPPLSFSNSLTSFKDGLDELQNVQAISDFFTFDASGSCPIWQVQVSVFSVVIDQQCSPNIPWSLIRGIVIAVAVLLAARIALH